MRVSPCLAAWLHMLLYLLVPLGFGAQGGITLCSSNTCSIKLCRRSSHINTMCSMKQCNKFLGLIQQNMDKEL